MHWTFVMWNSKMCKTLRVSITHKEAPEVWYRLQFYHGVIPVSKFFLIIIAVSLCLMANTDRRDVHEVYSNSQAVIVTKLLVSK